MYLPYWLLLVSASYELPEEVPGKVKYIRGAVTKFPELWYSTVMVGHMTTLI